MKYLYFIFTFFMLFNTANSQSFVDQGNEWVQNGSFLAGGFYPIFYFVEGDTLIGGHTYAKVLFYENFGNASTDTTYYAAIREVNDSVFIIDSDASEADERLIYDWNSLVVDTTEVTTYPTTRLETIDTITLLNGEQRRRFSYTAYREIYPTDQLDTMYNYRTVIEGIGEVDENVFHRGYIATPELSPPFGLRCFSKNGELLWLNPIYDVDCESLILATQKLGEKTPFKLFPNPVQDVLYLEWLDNKQMKGCLNVYSATGGMVYTQEFSGGAVNHEISTKTWVKGLYFILFISENGKQFVSQLVKV